MKEFSTIHSLLSWQAEERPDAVSIRAPGRHPLTYGSLLDQVDRSVKSLNALGISRNDRVAIVLPNGPEMAAVFLSVAAGATCAPLNPSYSAKEFEFYLTDLNAKALLTLREMESPAREVAQSLGIPVLEITSETTEDAGVFSLADASLETDPVVEFSSPNDVALVLHTSGTTSKPKIVPLTQKNLCSSAQNIARTLQLREHDCCLNVMPLFHIHGLMAAVLSSISAGASMVCTPGFQVDSFFEWLRAYQPTWYTAVPTMHQSILSQIQAEPAIVGSSSLRFIRSSSASLPPPVMEGLENAFDAPMIESYGMTEAAHQMASNPLPPEKRRAGCVGIEAGPEIRIMDEAGLLLPVGATGEIVIMGENVTSGYENNAIANKEAYTDGWFRTGDEGVMDAEGYLTITGRLKEMVNRGGEKIAPREIDEALLEHPEIDQAVAFSVPHPTLGEDLAAAVVLCTDAKSTEKALREFLFSRLADFKVPSQIIVVGAIPKGATGKLQRIGLADKLSLDLKSEYLAPRNPFEEGLVTIWKNVLKQERVGIQDNFFALGGDSILAAAVVKEMESLVHRTLELPIVFQAPTIEQIASRLQGSSNESDSYLIPVRPEGSRPPLFLVPGHGGDIFTYTLLARYLHPEQPVFVFRFPEPARLDNDVANKTLEEMAVLYVEEMMELQPEGPYHLGGFCFGAEVTWEMAQQLHVKGKKAGLVAIIFMYQQGAARKALLSKRLSYHFGNLFTGSIEKRVAYVKLTTSRIIERLSRKLMPSVSRRYVSTELHRGYLPHYYPGRVTLFDPVHGSGDGNEHDPYMGLKGLAAEIEAFSVPGNRYTIFKEPGVQVLAEKISLCLERSASGQDAE